MFNRLTWPQMLCEELTKRDCEVILVDNGSIYQPLLDWYKECPYKVHLLDNTYNHKSPWTANIVEGENYIVTDHDLDISGVPDDMVEFLFKGLRGGAVKSGLSLRLDDLPENEFTDEVVSWERKFWETKQDRDGFYHSDIDTTLALYSARRLKKVPNFFNAVRAPYPYTARHLPWYLTPSTVTEEEDFYSKNLNTCGYWTTKYVNYADKIQR